MGRYLYPTSPRAPRAGDPGDEVYPLPDYLRFLRLIWAVCHELESHSKRTERRVGVTMPQRLVVRLLGHRGEMSSGDLSAALHLHPSTLTGVLRRLEVRGLVRRREHPDDRRRRLFRLTAAGRRVDRHDSDLETLVTAALAGLRPSEQDAARRTLELIASSLQRGHPR